MHPQQKAAWLNLVVCAAAAVLYLAAVPLLSWYFDRPWASVLAPATGVFGLCGLGGFARYFYLPRKNGKPVMDERDQLLWMRAWRTGMVIFWLVFVTGCVGSWAFMQYVRGLDRITIPTQLFPIIAFVAYIIVTIAQSAATLCYYGWRPTDAADR